MKTGRHGRELKVPENLPPSSDKDFWGDSEIGVIKRHSFEMNNHYPVYIRGGVFVCKGCPFEHTLPLSTDKFTVKDGHVLPLDKAS
jgi:hypothetical protein